MELLERTQYINQLDAWRDKQVVKVITGRLFGLLRLAVSGGGEVDASLFSGMSDGDWEVLLEVSHNQGVSAVAFEGIGILPSACRPGLDVLMNWIAQTDYVVEQYRRHLEVASDLVGRWRRNGVRTMVIKGLAHSRYYSHPDHREWGDFDCYQFGCFEEGNRLAAEFGASVEDKWYKHSKIFYSGLTVENHRFFTAVGSNRHAKDLNDYMVKAVGDGSGLGVLEGTEILLPPLEAEGLFFLYHSLIHFLFGGLSVRHFCDWAYWIKENQKLMVWSEFYSLCGRFGLGGIADVMNTVATDFFGVTLNFDFHGDVRLAERVIRSVVNDDFLSADRKNGRFFDYLRIAGGVLSDSWKYRQVARCSMIVFLAGYVRGLAFRKF